MTSSRGDWAKSDCEIKTVASASDQARRRLDQKRLAADVRRLTLMRKAELRMRETKIKVSSHRQMQRRGFCGARRDWQPAEVFRRRNSKKDRFRVISLEFPGRPTATQPKSGAGVSIVPQDSRNCREEGKSQRCV
jgi:hypothetical protein